MNLVKYTPLTMALTAIVSMSAFAADEVAKDSSFVVTKKPKIWTAGSQICFKKLAKSAIENCATVTPFGEAQLRMQGQSSDEVKQKYLSLLTQDQQDYLKSYNEFVVRYLSLDEVGSNYIVEIHMSAGPHSSYLNTGTQSIFVYGFFHPIPESDGVYFRPQAFGESDPSNWSSLRSKTDDQVAIEIATSVINRWAQLISSTSSTAKP